MPRRLLCRAAGILSPEAWNNSRHNLCWGGSRDWRENFWITRINLQRILESETLRFAAILIICESAKSPAWSSPGHTTGEKHPPHSQRNICFSHPDSRLHISSCLDDWGTNNMSYSSLSSDWREMTNEGGHPHFNTGNQSGGSHTPTRYVLKKQHHHRCRSSSPMGRVILINAPVDGEFKAL